METAFQQAGLEFNKTRAARVFLKKVGTNPDEVLSADALNRFEALFKAINERFRHMKQAS